MNNPGHISIFPDNPFLLLVITGLGRCAALTRPRPPALNSPTNHDASPARPYYSRPIVPPAGLAVDATDRGREPSR